VVAELLKYKEVLVELSASFRCDKQSEREFDVFAMSVPVSSTPVRNPGPEQFKDANITEFKGTLNFKPLYKLKADDVKRLNRSIMDSEGLCGGTGKSQSTLMDCAILALFGWMQLRGVRK